MLDREAGGVGQFFEGQCRPRPKEGTVAVPAAHPIAARALGRFIEGKCRSWNGRRSSQGQCGGRERGGVGGEGRETRDEGRETRDEGQGTMQPAGRGVMAAILVFAAMRYQSQFHIERATQ
jgi:hypothetical protein